ncbi:MAG: hypothetical protein PVI90_07715 [Desulfobacteraceae bacterium]
MKFIQCFLGCKENGGFLYLCYYIGEYQFQKLVALRTSVLWAIAVSF